MQSSLPVAVMLLSGLQQSLCAMAASKNESLPVCASIPKIVSFGSEYQSRIPPPEGSVVVEVTIELSGRVSAARIVKSSDSRLDERALKDAEKWVFGSSSRP